MNKMKKTIAILLVALIAALLLTSCGGSSGYEPPANGGADGGYTLLYDGESETLRKAVVQDEGYSYSQTVNNAGRPPGDSGVVNVMATIVDENLADKIIYTVNAEIETINFDETIDGVYALLTDNRGFIESSYIGGRNYAQSYHGWQTYRNAQFTLRIPKDRLNTVTASLETLGNVTSLRSDTENITARFFDTQSRLNSLRTQEERLLDMLGKSENVTDMIDIEERLSDVRYEIETLTSTLRNWQNQVDYSSLTLFIQEVEILTEIMPVKQRTYWQQIGDGLAASTRGVGDFFMSLFKWLIINLPVLIIFAVIAVVLVFIVRRWIRRDKKREKQNPPYPPYPENGFDPQNPPYPQSLQQQPNSQEPQNPQDP